MLAEEELCLACKTGATAPQQAAMQAWCHSTSASWQAGLEPMGQNGYRWMDGLMDGWIGGWVEENGWMGGGKWQWQWQ
eukprot:6350414-Lingulodinium_polyedra.AAC.1